MYHEENLINGILCWRGTPDGEWQEFTQRELSYRLKLAEESLSAIRALLSLQ